MEATRALIEQNIRNQTPLELKETDYLEVRSTLLSLKQKYKKDLAIKECSFVEQEIQRLDTKYNVVELNEHN